MVLTQKDMVIRVNVVITNVEVSDAPKKEQALTVLRRVKEEFSKETECDKTFLATSAKELSEIAVPPHLIAIAEQINKFLQN